ncbi:hypothetical protein AURDEDRAFT_173800 [Auricularia subglabra TFB-10046 SS5]|nr:hypothetical protein AURDEDRAFT_173800 [Auricularia subglabra TFB-10046 SS5]
MHNASIQQARLPPEVWCTVWSFLSDDELFRVTQVCSSWRSRATGYAAFWKHVRFWTAVHAAGEDCEDGMCECPTTVTEPLHNLPEVSARLERSNAVPITLEVCIYPVFSDHRLARRLAKIVQPHAHRITNLICRFGDVSFFIDFMHRAEHFDSLRLLHMSRISYCQNEQNIWPFSKMRLDELELPQLQEFRGYGDFIWNIAYQPETPAFPSLERLRCDFRDARSLLDCLQCCPRLVFLNSQLCELPATAPTATPLDCDTEPAPLLRVLILDVMTPQWASLIAPLIHRPTLTDLTLRYAELDQATLFSPFATLSGELRLKVQADSYRIIVVATDANASVRRLQFSADYDLTPYIPVLRRVWRYVSNTLSDLTMPWDLRAALLDTALRAARLSRINFTGASGSSPPILELMALNDAAFAGRPQLPALSTLAFSGYRNHPLSSAAAEELAAALSDSAPSLDYCCVELL